MLFQGGVCVECAAWTCVAVKVSGPRTPELTWFGLVDTIDESVAFRETRKRFTLSYTKALLPTRSRTFLFL